MLSEFWLKKSWLVGAPSGGDPQAVALWGGRERNSLLPNYATCYSMAPLKDSYNAMDEPSFKYCLGTSRLLIFETDSIYWISLRNLFSIRVVVKY